ncbi:MAG: hypothetical protein VB048_08220 [Bacteroidaceae bacterium]|nr:hypothetical protein [Bacteroidaceae bacterium]
MNRKIIAYFDHNIYGEFIPLSTDKYIDYQKLLFWGEISKISKEIRIVYSIWHIFETQQIKGENREKLIKAHLNTIANFTGSKCLVCDDNKFWIRDCNPYEQFHNLEDMNIAVQNISGKLLGNNINDLSQDMLFFLNKIIKEKGNVIKVIISFLNSDHINAARRLINIGKLNSLDAEKAFNYIDDSLEKEHNKQINVDDNYKNSYVSVFRNTEYISIIDIFSKYGLDKDKYYERNLGKSIILEIFGYKAQSIKDYVRKSTAPIFDSLHLSYCLNNVDFFVTEDIRLRSKMDIYKKMYNIQIISLKNFIAILDGFSLSDKNFQDLYSQIKLGKGICK